MTTALRYLRKLAASDHGIFFYHTVEEKRRLLFSFLKTGLDKGKGAVYIAGEDDPQTIRRGMLNFGIDVKNFEREGLLNIVNYNRWYIVNGKVEIPKIIGLWKKAYEDALDRGLKGLHVCGEMDCFFQHNLVKELIEYEKACGRRLKIPMAALCSYQINRIKLLKGNFFYRLIKSHGHVLSPSFAGTVRFESLYPQVVNETLQSMFGKTCTELLLLFLNINYSISETELVNNPEGFFAKLRDMLGSQADLIEKRTLQNLYMKLGLKH